MKYSNKNKSFETFFLAFEYLYLFCPLIWGNFMLVILYKFLSKRPGDQNNTNQNKTSTAKSQKRGHLN